jgi:hypothetical protein
MSLIDTVFTRSQFTRSHASAGLLLSAALLMSACASIEPQPEPQQVPDFPGQTLPDGSVRLDTGDARIAQLWSASEQSAIEGDDAQALEYVYQALELDPQNSLLWSRAAEIQLDNDQPAQAENFAVKSNLFAAQNRGLLYRNWLIIEHARNVRGDLLGERSAHRKVQEYKYQ